MLDMIECRVTGLAIESGADDSETCHTHLVTLETASPMEAQNFVQLSFIVTADDLVKYPYSSKLWLMFLTEDDSTREKLVAFREARNALQQGGATVNAYHQAAAALAELLIRS